MFYELFCVVGVEVLQLAVNAFKLFARNIDLRKRESRNVLRKHVKDSFNKTEAAVFLCRLCFLRAFPFISLILLTTAVV